MQKIEHYQLLVWREMARRLGIYSSEAVLQKVSLPSLIKNIKTNGISTLERRIHTEFTKRLGKRPKIHVLDKDCAGHDDIISLMPIPKRFAVIVEKQCYDARYLKEWITTKKTIPHTKSNIGNDSDLYKKIVKIADREKPDERSLRLRAEGRGHTQLDHPLAGMPNFRFTGSEPRVRTETDSNETRAAAAVQANLSQFPGRHSEALVNWIKGIVYYRINANSPLHIEVEDNISDFDNEDITGSIGIQEDELPILVKVIINEGDKPIFRTLSENGYDVLSGQNMTGFYNIVYALNLLDTLDESTIRHIQGVLGIINAIIVQNSFNLNWFDLQRRNILHHAVSHSNSSNITIRTGIRDFIQWLRANRPGLRMQRDSNGNLPKNLPHPANLDRYL